MSNEKPPVRLDWDGVERDFKAGLLPLGMICAKWGIGLANLNRIAYRKGWERQEVHPPSPPPLGGGVPPGSSLTPADAAGIQARQILGIVNEHRRDVNKVRAMSNLMLERLFLHLTGTTIEMPLLGGRESPGDLLKKLAGVTVVMIQLEREILGLSSHVTPIEGDDGQTEWNAVKKLLDAIHIEKVEDVHDISPAKDKVKPK